MSKIVSANKKSICFLTRRLMVGGVERVLVDTMPLLTPYYNVTVVSLHGTPEASILQSLEESGATVLTPNLPEKNIFLLFPFLSKFHYEKQLKNIEYDYLVCVNSAAMNACFNKKAKKTVFWNHADTIEKQINPSTLIQKLKKKLFKFFYHRYDAIWAVCDKVTADYVAAFQSHNVYTLPNPINYKGILEKSDLPCDIEFNKNNLNVVALGRISTEKGFDRLVNSWGNIVKQIPNARLYIIGPGDTSCFTEALQHNNLTDKVFFLGKKDNPYPYLKQADLFVSPSREESFGLVIAEAMTLSIPVITTATAGGKYTTKDGSLAICVDNDEQALTESIIKFLKNPKEYPYSLEQAKMVAQSYDLPFFQENILRLLKQLEE